MTSVLAAIYRIQRDTGCVSPVELRLADKTLPVGLSTLERVPAEAMADEVFDLEFRTTSPDMG